MTGFARSDGAAGAHSWTFEIKSVNGRNLDVRSRLPSGFDQIDQQIRTAVAARLKRGSVSVNLSVLRQNAATQYRINRDLLDQLVALSREVAAAGVAPARVDGLLAVRGVIETVEEPETDEQRSEVEAAMLTTLDQALDRLADARLAEGARLITVLSNHLAEIERLVRAAAGTAAAQPAALRERLRGQLAALLDAVPALPEDRLAQEAALIVSKGDVREELDRLVAHVAAARDLLARGGAIGRQLDFLCQEFNREANTLCSKSADVELTRIGLALKASIEQLREQVQNIE
ncbi:YicC/YloC family endoribonuclease [Arenibaculum sp.]|uniref:YicC/YloC family endoribonuclease n=1 Tax=Arenibaculum sp. TaxID=2865862 RepID=UPI002E16121C|nr:YicC/YloC family endoribonuclease [Arenibaculum sp.]